MIWMKARRAVALSLSALTLGGLLAAPITAHAEDKGKIIIGPPIIIDDPQKPAPPPKPPKKEKK